jgi:predicted esterase
MRPPWPFALAALAGLAACHDPTTGARRAPGSSPAPARTAAPSAHDAPRGRDAPPDPTGAAPATDAGPAPDAPRPWPPAAPGPRTAWCDEPVDALDEATCYVLPAAPPDELLIYLHGIVPPNQTSAQKTNLQRVVANAARRAGVAALIPRGEQGLGPAGLERWWSWPTGESSYRRRGPTLVRALEDARGRLEALAGVRFAKLYLAGSSAGAYFVAELALHGALRAHGYAAISGGAARPTAELASLEPAPFYVGHSTHESGESARALGELVRRAGWPTRLEARPVPHGAHEAYLDGAFALWRERAASVPVPP